MEQKILLADDALFMRLSIKKSLQPLENVIFLEAADGQEACDIYEKEKPDLVIMDITMPKMNGIEAVKEIRRKDPSARILMCSAMGQESMVIESVRAGALDFVVKPFKADMLLGAVRKIFDAEKQEG